MKFFKKKNSIISFTICVAYVLASCDKPASIKEDFMKQRMEQVIIEKKQVVHKITFTDKKLKWDTADFIVKYLGKKIDTTTNAFELKNASVKNKEKIIKLINEIEGTDLEYFKRQIENQDIDSSFKKKVIEAESKTVNVGIAFSQPLISIDNNTIILKEEISNGDCYIKAISVFKRTDNKWTMDFDIYRYITCN